MNRNFYFIGIAFFGMINGIFNQLGLIFTLLYVQPIAGPLLFGNLSLTLMFASLMVSTATVILGGIPAAMGVHFPTVLTRHAPGINGNHGALRSEALS
jgi:hypothetical protein